MMLLDEPTAGMTHTDVDKIAALIKKVAANRTVLMVEHNLSVVSNLSDHITVLARGEILAQGDYATVSRTRRSQAFRSRAWLNRCSNGEPPQVRPPRRCSPCAA